MVEIPLESSTGFAILDEVVAVPWPTVVFIHVLDLAYLGWSQSEKIEKVEWGLHISKHVDDLPQAPLWL